MKKKTFNIIVYKDYLLNPELSKGEKLLFLILRCYANEEGEDCFPSEETLSNVTKCSPRTIRTELKGLLHKGYIERKKTRDKGGKFLKNNYKLLKHHRQNLPMDKKLDNKGDNETDSKTLNNNEGANHRQNLPKNHRQILPNNNIPYINNKETEIYFYECSYFKITEQFKNELLVNFGNLAEGELKREFFKMVTWLETSGNTKKNYKMFIINWLTKTNDSTIKKIEEGILCYEGL